VKIFGIRITTEREHLRQRALYEHVATTLEEGRDYWHDRALRAEARCLELSANRWNRKPVVIWPRGDGFVQVEVGKSEQ
jgi:hypothetical protein